jgi:NADH dehydrogenase/NADH:ubiquinone oxidoreductase subunit G
MSDMVTLKIDNREVKALAGTTVMEAAREANIHIPNLCSNPELEPYGACRMCMVEITHGKRTRLVASCIYEVAEGLTVKTDTDRANNVRRLVIELMLSRNPKHPALLQLAEQLGVEKSRFDVDVKGCILCGQCVRTCREVVGVSAIGFEGRGTIRKVATPFNESPAECIACGSCAYVCPVDVIPLKEKDGVRTIWQTDFPLLKCQGCGRYIAPKRQLEHFAKLTDQTLDDLTKSCVHCR